MTSPKHTGQDLSDVDGRATSLSQCKATGHNDYEFWDFSGIDSVHSDQIAHDSQTLSVIDSLLDVRGGTDNFDPFGLFSTGVHVVPPTDRAVSRPTATHTTGFRPIMATVPSETCSLIDFSPLRPSLRSQDQQSSVQLVQPASQIDIHGLSPLPSARNSPVSATITQHQILMSRSHQSLTTGIRRKDHGSQDRPASGLECPGEGPSKTSMTIIPTDAERNTAVRPSSLKITAAGPNSLPSQMEPVLNTDHDSDRPDLRPLSNASAPTEMLSLIETIHDMGARLRSLSHLVEKQQENICQQQSDITRYRKEMTDQSNQMHQYFIEMRKQQDVINLQQQEITRLLSRPMESAPKPATAEIDALSIPHSRPPSRLMSQVENQIKVENHPHFLFDLGLEGERKSHLGDC